jgi:hypothetical protein
MPTINQKNQPYRPRSIVRHLYLSSRPCLGWTTTPFISRATAFHYGTEEKLETSAVIQTALGERDERTYLTDREGAPSKPSQRYRLNSLM